MDYYFPSCNFKLLFPEIHKKINRYLKNTGIKTLDCCRIDNKILRNDDTAYTICTNCSLILSEITNANVVSILNYIDSDIEFHFPDYNWETFILQNCAKSNKDLDALIMRLLNKMKIDVILSKYQHYCGSFMMKTIEERNLRIAPKTFKKMNDKIIPMSDKEINDRISQMIETFPDNKVITYCNSCYKGLLNNKADVYHIAQLLFRDY